MVIKRATTKEQRNKINIKQKSEIDKCLRYGIYRERSIMVIKRARTKKQRNKINN